MRNKERKEKSKEDIEIACGEVLILASEDILRLVKDLMDMYVSVDKHEKEFFEDGDKGHVSDVELDFFMFRKRINKILQDLRRARKGIIPKR